MRTNLPPSIFNDVVGPVMRGPSSSHSAAAARIGLLIHDLCGGVPDRVVIDYDTMGSLATTHTSQGTDIGLYGGLLGWTPDDHRIPESPAALRDHGTTVEVRYPRLDDAHPNTYRIAAMRDGSAHDIVAVSTGGGMIEVTRLDGIEVRLFGDYVVTLVVADEANTDLGTAIDELDGVETHDHAGASPQLHILMSRDRLDSSGLEQIAGVRAVHRLRAVLPVISRRDMSVPFEHASQLLPNEDLSRRPLSDWALDYETARGGIRERQVLDQATALIGIMRRGVETGLHGTEYEDWILGWQSGRFVQLASDGRLLDGGLLNQMIGYVTALMEAKSAMEVIVAAPTAGSCATFPGALLAAVDQLAADDDRAARALLTGGLIGVFVTNRSSFAAEVGGCQAETGAGAAMNSRVVLPPNRSRRRAKRCRTCSAWCATRSATEWKRRASDAT